MPVEHSEIPKRKPREKPAPYQRRKPKEGRKKDAPKTSARPKEKKTKDNLTLNDWNTIYKFVDEHPHMSQQDIVSHFATLEKPLIFSQATLCRKLKPEMRSQLEKRTLETLNALSSKRPRVVTRPDVEKALFAWVKHMEAKSQTVNGPMLKEKRQRFEELFNVPQEERLTGDGWIRSFCKAYNIRERRRHGEAASVDQESVKAERLRLKELLKPYQRKDIYNFDETSFFAFAPPDRGLCTQRMNGHKKDKSRITIGVGCNADGTDKLELIYIGKAKRPRCFGKTPIERQGFYYRNNKKAWMTSLLFEEWIKKLDTRMQSEHRSIALLIDNFSGHFIDYTPWNIEIIHLEPNLTPFVQPCDAGIIRCVKAHYRRAYCMRAIAKDDADEQDIFKIDLLEGMTMVKDAWKNVTMQTIVHCWDHTGILPDFNKAQTHPKSSVSTKVALGWDVMREYAVSASMTLPQAESKLKEIFGEEYNDTLWRPAINTVIEAENDDILAELVMYKLGSAWKLQLKLGFSELKPSKSYLIFGVILVVVTTVLVDDNQAVPAKLYCL
ncbi:hypothetical protein D9613_008852 [Agrocybe pediades]|uniref:HTH CENPB-type domain-containing protein n=1 Tax=Agrocybe pediades TaxID=84607 RepID=A0A8H4VNR3_9AGAR|nr:hypothetical protein D9613_008852 [Agrocybe pediades]